MQTEDRQRVLKKLEVINKMVTVNCPDMLLAEVMFSLFLSINRITKGKGGEALSGFLYRVCKNDVGLCAMVGCQNKISPRSRNPFCKSCLGKADQTIKEALKNPDWADAGL